MGIEGIPAGALKMRRIRCREEVCIGCRLCEVWCQVEHSKSKEIINAFLRETAFPRVRVEERGPISISLQCRHCEEPNCVHACISGALYRDLETCVVKHDASKCVGCWSCVLACPYDAIIRDDAHNRVLKCDLCEGREEPICVEKCPNDALIVEAYDAL